MSAAPSDSPDPSDGPAPDHHDATGGPHEPEHLGWLPQDLAQLDTEHPPRIPRGRLLAGLLSAGLVIALLAWALPWATGASWTQILGTLGDLPAWAVPAMVALGVGALLLEAVTVRTALPGARWSGALWGHSAAGATGLALPGALWAALLAVLGAALSLVLTAVLLRRRVLTAFLAQLGAVVPEHIREGILVQRDALVQMLRRRPLPLLAPTLGARVLQWLALVIAIEAVGAEVPLLLTIAIFALGRVLSLVPLTPGGAGITETVGAAALVALGVASADAAGAMLLLLVTMLVVPLLAGALGIVAAFTRSAGRHPAQSDPRW